MRKRIQMNIKQRCSAWRDRYPGMDGSYFEGLTRDLFHWYGEDYGHSQGFDDLVTIGGTCFR
jgi:hypothetical protein